MTKKSQQKDADRMRLLKTGVPGFDAVIGGGLPEYSFNLIAGGPGAGKTTLAQQIAFASATAARPALYFTVLGEPTLKMLRYQRQFSFFDPSKVGKAIQYINLSAEALERDLNEVLARIVSEVERAKPGIIVVDSFRTIGGGIQGAFAEGAFSVDHFIQRLALHLTSWEVTSFLLGEYAEQEQRSPVFTVADGVFWLSQVTDRNSVVRKLQVIKTRGAAPMPGLHTFRITDDGVQIFPRIPEQQRSRKPQAVKRLSTGVPGLDEIMGGGIPSGDAVMVAGPAGSGKTTFATQFAAEGLRLGESVVIVVFEEYPEEYLARATFRNQSLEKLARAGKLRIIYLRPLDLSVDETLAEILQAVGELQPERVVIDSLSGFEIALAPTFREDFRESLYRLVGALTATGVTVYMTAEIVAGYPGPVTNEKVSFITDDIIVQRFVEIGGELRQVLVVVKMRGSAHSRDFRLYDVGAGGAVVGASLRDYHGIITGAPELQPRVDGIGHLGLTSRESAILDALVRLGGGSADEIAVRVGSPPGEITQSLERLEALGYITVTKGVYRAEARANR